MALYQTPFMEKNNKTNHIHQDNDQKSQHFWNVDLYSLEMLVNHGSTCIKIINK